MTFEKHVKPKPATYFLDILIQLLQSIKCINTVFAKIRILKIRVLNSCFSNSFLGNITTDHLENPTSPPVLEEFVLILVFYLRDEFGKSRV